METEKRPGTPGDQQEQTWRRKGKLRECSGDSEILRSGPEGLQKDQGGGKVPGGFVSVVRGPLEKPRGAGELGTVL